MFRRKGKEEKRITVREPKEKETETRALAPWRPYDMWKEMDRMWEDFRTNFDDLFLRPFSMTPSAGYLRELREPFADLVDTGKEYKITAELPGVPKEKVEVNITRDSVEISAEAGKELKEEKEGYIRQERGYARFYRCLAFPSEVIPEKAEASLNHGVLEVKVPKKEPTPEPKKHRIQIK